MKIRILEGTKTMDLIVHAPSQQDSYLLTEDQYMQINQWCIDMLGYHARTSFETFQFRSQADITAFRLRWS